jgi:predicted O-linked N-acetylglucosamine transferase (SPINDLY family)
MRIELVKMLLDEGRAPEARDACRRLVQSSPKDPYINHLMSRALLRCAETVPALHYAQTAAALVPGDVDLALEFARLLVICGKSEKAVEVLLKAEKLRPDLASLPGLRSGALIELNRAMEATAAAQRALDLQPGESGRIAQLAACHLNAGYPEDAFALVAPLAERTGEPAMLSGAALLSNYCPGITRQQQQRLHLAYGAALDAAIPAPDRTYTGTRDPERPLRIALISPDLRSHSVAWFIEPFLEHHDRSRLNVFVYQTNALADAVTAKLRKHAHTWRVMDNISDHGLAEVIFGDQIDVAIELSGHTHAHSLACMHTKPAPVMLTYLGYPNITGVSGMSGRVVDAITDPLDWDTDHVGEPLLRTGAPFLCYKPPAAAPLAASAPCVHNGFVTFGSFNNAQKLNKAAIDLWSRVLQAVPGSKLLLKGVAFTEEALRRDVQSRFAEPSRVEILPRAASTADHLKLYDRIDIGLDPTPYNGTTTTCEALWMGVPVITLAGATHASRVSASILTAIGAGELISNDESGYIAAAASLAADHGRLNGYRASLRPAMASSPLCDGPGFCARFEDTIRRSWRQWCT